MDRQKGNEKMWTEIVQRIASGEKQAAIARELGLKAGTFHYRLKKFLANREQAQCEIAATVESVATSPGQVQPPAVSEESREYPETLFDESWTRKWFVSRLVLLVKEPTTVHVYWEVDEQKQQLVAKHFQSRWSDLPFFLQLYDVTDIDFNGYNAHRTLRIQVPPDADNWYIHDVEPQRRYLVDFGTITWNGDFFTILRSNTAGTPSERTYQHAYGPVKFEPLTRNVKSDSTTVSNHHPESVQAVRLSQDKAGSARPYPGEFDGYTVRTGRGE